LRTGVSRRECLVGILGVAAGTAFAEDHPGKAPEGLDVTKAGADPTGKTDSTDAFRKALQSSKALYVPPGTYIVGGLELPAGTSIRGAGEGSVLKQAPKQRFVLWCDSGSPDPARNITSLRLENLQLRGTSDSDGFSEQIHLLSVNGVSDLSIDSVVFRGFRGDGIYLGGGATGAPRHNTRVNIYRCLFDGVNRENRNGLSVIDCAGLVVEDCRFINSTRPNMPGAIDLEPNANTFHVIRNVKIAHNRFANIRGIGVIGFYSPVVLSTPPSDIVIEDNTIDDCPADMVFFFMMPASAAASSGEPSFIFRNNKIRNSGGRAFSVRGVPSGIIADNQYSQTKKAAQIGFEKPNDTARGIKVTNNVFDHCASEDDAGVQVYTVNDLKFERNQFIDCGNGTPNASAVQLLKGSGAGLSFAGNTFAAPTHRMTYSVKASDDFRASPGSIMFAPDNVRRDNLSVAFPGATR
jgi:hypothetical protein